MLSQRRSLNNFTNLSLIELALTSGLRTSLPHVHGSRRNLLSEDHSTLPSAIARLQALQISFWTNVRISNELAARVVALYLQVEQPVYGFVDPDLFLNDLLAHRTQYCSPLLVNAILFWSCVSCILIRAQLREHPS